MGYKRYEYYLSIRQFEVLQRHNICLHKILKNWIQGVAKWLQQSCMCEMVSYMVSGKKYVINANRGRLVPCSILDYLYLHPKTFVSVSEATHVRIHIRTKNMKISMVSVISVRIRLHPYLWRTRIDLRASSVIYLERPSKMVLYNIIDLSRINSMILDSIEVMVLIWLGCVCLPQLKLVHITSNT